MRELKEFPIESVNFDLDIQLSDKQLNMLLNFPHPVGMDSKWNVLFKRNFIYFYRTWTGFCIYKVEIENNKLIKIFINNNVEQYKFLDDEKELILFHQFFDFLLKGKIS